MFIRSEPFKNLILQVVLCWRREIPRRLRPRRRRWQLLSKHLLGWGPSNNRSVLRTFQFCPATDKLPPMQHATVPCWRSRRKAKNLYSLNRLFFLRNNFYRQLGRISFNKVNRNNVSFFETGAARPKRPLLFVQSPRITFGIFFVVVSEKRGICAQHDENGAILSLLVFKLIFQWGVCGRIDCADRHLHPSASWPQIASLQVDGHRSMAECVATIIDCCWSGLWQIKWLTLLVGIAPIRVHFSQRAHFQELVCVIIFASLRDLFKIHTTKAIDNFVVINSPTYRFARKIDSFVEFCAGNVLCCVGGFVRCFHKC